MHLTKQLDITTIILITHYFLSSPVPVLTMHSPWSYKVPSYVGGSYFCDTGAHTFTLHDDYNKVFMDDPLWDGEGCSGSSTCCSFNSPPWVCQHLKYHTSDGLDCSCVHIGVVTKKINSYPLWRSMSSR